MRTIIIYKKRNAPAHYVYHPDAVSSSCEATRLGRPIPIGLGKTTDYIVKKTSWGKIAIGLAQIAHKDDGSLKELQDVI